MNIVIVHSNISIIFLKALSLTSDKSTINIIVDKRFHQTYKLFNFNFKVLFEDSDFFWDYRDFCFQKKLLLNRVKFAFGENNFHLFLPHTNNPMYAALASSDLCIKYSIYEEGFLAHSAPSEQLISINIIKKTFINFIAKGYNYFKGQWLCESSKFNLYYYIFEGAFKNKKMRQKVNFNDTKNISTIDKNIDALLIFDALIESHLCKEENVLKILENFINSIDFKITKLGIKFHPSSSNLIKKKILLTLKKSNINYVKINDSILLEEVILSYHISKYKFHVYGFVSSLLYYSILNNIPTHSLAVALAEIDDIFKVKSFERFKNTFPENVYNKIIC